MECQKKNEGIDYYYHTVLSHYEMPITELRMLLLNTVHLYPVGHKVCSSLLVGS